MVENTPGTDNVYEEVCFKLTELISSIHVSTDKIYDIESLLEDYDGDEKYDLIHNLTDIKSGLFAQCVKVLKLHSTVNAVLKQLEIEC